jgi:CBS domain-containing protein
VRLESESAAKATGTLDRTASAEDTLIWLVEFSEFLTGGRMKTVRQLLETKGHEVVSISPDKSVFEAMQLMAAMNIGALLVLEAGGKLVGIVSERDYARKMHILNKSVKDAPITEIMTRKVAYVRPEQTNVDCMALITEKRVRHLPVLENGRVIGMVSIGDLVKDTISEQEFIIHQLENYIHG